MVAGLAAAGGLAVEVQVGTGKPVVVPDWLPSWVKTDDLKHISEAVAAAEGKTRGEIVPLIVRSSGYYGHVLPLVTVILFISAILLELQFVVESFDLPVLLSTPLVLVLCYVLAVPLAKMSWVCRALTLNRDEIRAVEARAELEFYRGSYDKTEGHSAILIFVSWLERRAVVLADKAIAQKIGKDVCDELVHTLLKGLGGRQFAKGWGLTIQRAGEVLAQHFPAGANKPNELSNDLVIKD